MNNFKVGDIVECIDPVHDLIRGKLYEVVGTDCEFILIEENIPYYARRFRLAKRAEAKSTTEIRVSKGFKAALDGGVIAIYTGKKPDFPFTVPYTFKTSSPLAIDYELIKKDLTRKNPLAIIHRSDGFHRAVVHDSIVQKAIALFDNASDIDYISAWRKTEKGNIQNIINTVKYIKKSPWPNKKETTFKVDIIKL